VTSRPLRLAFIGFALLGAAVSAAYVYDRYLRHAAALPRAASLAPAARPEATVRVPALRPDFTLKDTAGRLHSAREWDGKALLVNFWATWCAPCRREIPLLNRLRREYAGQGVEVLGIAVDFADDVIAYRQRFPIDYPVLVGEQDGFDAARAFGVASVVFPFTAFTDTRGRVLTVHVGELHEAEARAILSVVGQVDAGRLSPLEAREAIRNALAALPKDTALPAG
jgi:thiol-disulfide isomerase/thioredoxin